MRTDYESTRIDRVRTAALDTYDGTTWTSSDTYRVAGRNLTVDPELRHSKTVTAHIELKELSGPYLPVIGWPSRLTSAGGGRGRFGYNPASGVVVDTGSPAQGLSYDVTGEVGLRDDGLTRAGRSENHLPPLPPGVPEGLADTSRRFGDTYHQLVELETRLRAKPYRLNRPPGHSYAALSRFMSDEADIGSGYAEQAAATFAVLARSWGFAARVAVGYRLHDYQHGVFQVTTADAHAWPEVHFAGYGWVVFEPTNPDNKSKPNPPVEAPRVVPPHPAPPATAPATAAPATASQPAEGPDEQGFSWNRVLAGTVAFLPAAVLLVVLAAGFVVVAKAHRRERRRTGGDHAARVLGAWHEQLDRLTERGISPPVSLTFHEVAEHVRKILGEVANPIEATAELATTAIYAPERLDQAASDRAWELVAQLGTALHPRRVSAARLLALFDPRPLWTTWSLARQRRQAGESLEVGRYR
ncbi:MAG: transglutaminase domain-containing protein [Saccharothrix sp.]|nr:transglutaminase domain-containing protein [Saccharothrix sp.]